MEAADLSGKRGDDILRRIAGDGDDVDAALAVGDAHPADDVFSVGMQKLIERLYGIRVRNDNADHGNSGIHERLSFWRNSVFCIKIRLYAALFFARRGKCFLYLSPFPMIQYFGVTE